MSKMFSFVTQTWNPVVGCLHDCNYCWARRLAETRLKHIERYQGGFKPKLIERELQRGFKFGLIFVSDMGDLFGKWVEDDWINQVLNTIRSSPNATFLLQTKNPERYCEFLSQFSENIVLGATIETNRECVAGKAPPRWRRYQAMKNIRGFRKFIAIEPIMDFDEVFVDWIRDIDPCSVEVGMDNYGNALPEPKREKISWLLDELSQICTVVEKESLRKGERVLGRGHTEFSCL